MGLITAEFSVRISSSQARVRCTSYIPSRRSWLHTNKFLLALVLTKTYLMWHSCQALQYSHSQVTDSFEKFLWNCE